MRRFARLELADDAMLDETKILKFRHHPERHGLAAQMMNIINDTLADRGLLLKGGIVDATIIHAPPSTKNEQKNRDPEMVSGGESELRTTKRVKRRYFGTRIHVGADANFGLMHTYKKFN